MFDRANLFVRNDLFMNHEFIAIYWVTKDVCPVSGLTIRNNMFTDHELIVIQKIDLVYWVTFSLGTRDLLFVCRLISWSKYL